MLGRKNEPAAYRPIGVTCTLGRVFEMKTNQAIDYHLESNGLIDDSQHGFRRGKSCETNLLMLMEYHAQRAEDGDDEDNVYFDLRAFFDGIPHQRCLESLHAHGVAKEGKIHKWITLWLGAVGGDSRAGGQEPGAGARRRSTEQGAGRSEQGARASKEATKGHSQWEGQQVA